ncbi:hypothetical protein M422DRAFT_239136 [Sphaerobolus stellatus SS14]|nr:hypothetical protein M422DRAFT_239136 [Sphaerobolus stellatus SS14]
MERQSGKDQNVFIGSIPEINSEIKKVRRIPSDQLEEIKVYRSDSDDESSLTTLTGPEQTELQREESKDNRIVFPADELSSERASLQEEHSVTHSRNNSNATLAQAPSARFSEFSRNTEATGTTLPQYKEYPLLSAYLTFDLIRSGHAAGCDKKIS